MKMAASCVHHVQLAVRNGSRYVHKLISNVNFKLFAERRDVDSTDWVLRSGSSIYVVSEHRAEVFRNPASQVPRNSGRDDCSANPLTPSPTLAPAFSTRLSEVHHLGYVSPPISTQNLRFELPSSALGNIDTVCNVAFEVCNVSATVELAQKGGAQVLLEPTLIKDSSGYVTVAAIKSCVGNVVHTILNTEHYDGVFLPGFSKVSELDLCNNSISSHNICDHSSQSCCQSDSDDLVKPESKETITHFDHVTFAIPTGTSNKVLDWYEKCFGMRRFWLDRNEDKLEGFLVRGSNVGLRMKAMEYWRCAETGLVFSEKSSNERTNHRQGTNMMFVVAEALPEQGPNQVETFIQQHGGPGVQHIGLYTPDIEYTVALLKERGLDFMVPPSTYYTEVGKLEEMKLVGKDPCALKELGILLDAEDFQDYIDDDAQDRSDWEDPKIRYLMQVFTRPFFDRDTFFLEVIQRQGACGFGAGNIKALWRSVEAYMVQKEATEKETQEERSEKEPEKSKGYFGY
nr:4-hydroxyphenylpyruvate dioxygenase-like protein [Lytechinus pictus]